MPVICDKCNGITVLSDLVRPSSFRAKEMMKNKAAKRATRTKLSKTKFKVRVTLAKSV